jgi:dethiobiotin synthetase
MFKKRAYFIAAVGTDIGKTFLVENLCRNLPDVLAIKPIASGFCDNDFGSDSAKILQALNLEISQENINKITPWRFAEAVSPHFAAEKSGAKINFLEVVKFCREKILEAEKNNKFLFIEAAGGVMTPINDNKTFLDLAVELQIPTLLVSANYLGAISHTLSAVKALDLSGVMVEKIIINENSPLFKTQENSIIETIKNFTLKDVVLLSDFFKKFS